MRFIYRLPFPKEKTSVEARRLWVYSLCCSNKCASVGGQVVNFINLHPLLHPDMDNTRMQISTLYAQSICHQISLYHCIDTVRTKLFPLKNPSLTNPAVSSDETYILSSTQPDNVLIVNIYTNFQYDRQQYPHWKCFLGFRLIKF